MKLILASLRKKKIMYKNIKFTSIEISFFRFKFNKNGIFSSLKIEIAVIFQSVRFLRSYENIIRMYYNTVYKNISMEQRLFIETFLGKGISFDHEFYYK